MTVRCRLLKPYTSVKVPERLWLSAFANTAFPCCYPLTVEQEAGLGDSKRPRANSRHEGHALGLTTRPLREVSPLVRAVILPLWFAPFMRLVEGPGAGLGEVLFPGPKPQIPYQQPQSKEKGRTTSLWETSCKASLVLTAT